MLDRGRKESVMIFNGVEVLKLQFSRAIDQTFEQFLDSWSLPLSEEGAQVRSYLPDNQFPTEIPVVSSSM
jgi:hypothetical protein